MIYRSIYTANNLFMKYEVFSSWNCHCCDRWMGGKQDRIVPSTITHVFGLIRGFSSIFKITVLILQATRATDGFGNRQMKGWSYIDSFTSVSIHFIYDINTFINTSCFEQWADRNIFIEGNLSGMYVFSDVYACTLPTSDD